MNVNLDRVFLALSDPHRLKLFTLIVEASKICDAEGEDFTYRGNCISNLQKHLDLSQSTVSHHIAILEESSLVESIRKGKWIHLFPVKETMNNLGKFIYDLIELSISKSEEMERIKAENITEENFEELMSLVANHGVKIVHHNPPNMFFLSDKQSIYSVGLNSKNIEIKSISGEDTYKSLEEIKSLIRKYQSVVS